MPGKRNRFIYQLFKDGVLVEEGTQDEILGDRFINRNQLYNAWKHKQKFEGEYMVERIRKDWKPEDNEEYWYCSLRGVFKDYFSKKSILCLMRFFVKNCYKTKEEALKNTDDLYLKLIKFYENS